MAEHIEREAFIEEYRRLYCENCDRRKGMKNGKLKFVYAIGEAPCRACDVGDMLDAVEDYPAADVVEVVRCKDCRFFVREYGCCRRVHNPKQYKDNPDDWFCADGVRKDG